MTGQFAGKHMTRLGEAVLSVADVVNIDIQFFIGSEGFVEVTGTVCGQVSLSCQRCLGELNHELRSEFALGVVREEVEVRNLPHRLDPWLIDSENGDLRGFVEDELLLNLPIVAMHVREDCEPGRSYSVDDGVDKRVQSENPFQVLEQLKKGSRG